MNSMMERRFRGLSYKNCGRTYKLTDAQKNSLPTKLLNFININGNANVFIRDSFFGYLIWWEKSDLGRKIFWRYLLENPEIEIPKSKTPEFVILVPSRYCARDLSGMVFREFRAFFSETKTKSFNPLFPG